MWNVEPANLKAYESLAQYHYVGTRPALVQQILCVREPKSRIAGVLVITYAPLNAAWRSEIWQDLNTNDRTARASALNATVRRIARVIVHPLYRGLGIASALLRTYLANPLTPRTEAVASMSPPLFTKCGMKQITSHAPPTRRDVLLAQALTRLNLQPWELMDSARATELIKEGGALRQAALAWVNGSRHSRGSAHLVRELMFAASRLTAPAPVFVYEKS